MEFLYAADENLSVNIIGIFLILLIVTWLVVFLKKSKQSTIQPTIKKEKHPTFDEFLNYIKSVYSKYFKWDDNIRAKSAYIAAKKEFAKKLLDNIENEEKFLEIYNTYSVKPELLNVELDDKFDVVENVDDVHIDFKVNFDKFNITNGTLTQKVKQLIIEWYKEGINDLKKELEYQVKYKDFEAIKNTLKQYL